jgi:uncharacterized protein YqgQ
MEVELYTPQTISKNTTNEKSEISKLSDKYFNGVIKNTKMLTASYNNQMLDEHVDVIYSLFNEYKSLIKLGIISEEKYLSILTSKNNKMLCYAIKHNHLNIIKLIVDELRDMIDINISEKKYYEIITSNKKLLEYTYLKKCEYVVKLIANELKMMIEPGIISEEKFYEMLTSETNLCYVFSSKKDFQSIDYELENAYKLNLISKKKFHSILCHNYHYTIGVICFKMGTIDINSVFNQFKKLIECDYITYEEYLEILTAYDNSPIKFSYMNSNTNYISTLINEFKMLINNGILSKKEYFNILKSSNYMPIKFANDKKSIDSDDIMFDEYYHLFKSGDITSEEFNNSVIIVK